MSRRLREMQEYGDSFKFVERLEELPASAGWTAEGGCTYASHFANLAALKLLAPL